ncbi:MULTISPECIES: inositol monophosphatase family protein [unclassified Corynebacterium]|uniref:inositol monophosphatase family protein n=1 Tax=unclassified Corynebacterium TaxID=2624378 RepID=UPI001EF68E45|nr:MULTISPECIES: inositol monophosphatase family protein [unclassified Corynebacterium]MCG7257936.1 inositol monophosphatase [Corynebacterium sp. ACRQK]MCG7262369.1 inositol monophosphatase [Corynebacterium sp. ACRQL]
MIKNGKVETMETTGSANLSAQAREVAAILQQAQPERATLRVFDEVSTAGEAGASQNEKNLSPADLEETALEVALEAAALIRRRRSELADEHGHVGVVGTKTSEVDPVTEVDQASENLIMEQLLARVPGACVLGEEGGLSREASGPGEILWIVDPIDGTVNFLYGVPAYAVSIAAVVDGQPVAGVVVDVTAQVAYVAHAGGTARRWKANATGVDTLIVEPVERAAAPDRALGKALVATGFSYVAEDRRRQAERLTRLLPKVRDIRRIGSAALDLCRVASGEVDAYFEHGLGPWDHAAGCLIAARAGAISVAPDYDVTKEEKALVLAVKPGVAAELAELLVE